MNKNLTFEEWIRDVMDDRLEYLDTEEKYKMYLDWKYSTEADRRK